MLEAQFEIFQDIARAGEYRFILKRFYYLLRIKRWMQEWNSISQRKRSESNNSRPYGITHA